MNVLHYVRYGPPISTGYVIRTNSITKAQKKLGINPFVVTSLKSLLNNYFTSNRFDEKKIVDDIINYSAKHQLESELSFKIISFLFNKNHKFSRKLLNIFYYYKNEKVLNNFATYLKDELKEIDLMHAHAPELVFNESLLINKKFRSKLIYEIRGFWNLSLENKDFNLIESVKDEVEACKKADKCIAICQGIADVLVEGGISAKKIDIVPNGVDPEKFEFHSKDENLLNEIKLNDKILFGYITNVRWFEGIQIIVKAWKRIKEEIPNAVFLLIGDGAYLPEIKSMINEFNIQDSFLVLGRIPHQKISQYYSILDVFIVPRINVPVSNIVTPLKPFEAMINKIPIIASDVNALKEMIIDGKTGLLFKADDYKNLADKCILLGKDSNLRTKIADYAKEWVITNRTWDSIANVYLNIYQNLLK